jgi:hypothetical protein
MLDESLFFRVQEKDIKDMGEGTPTFDVYMNDFLVAEIRGTNPDQRMIIPMRSLSEAEQDQLFAFLDQIAKDRGD